MKNKKIAEKDGIAIILVLFLLLIISTLTLSLFYMQILEVDLIDYEANYLQAFYLANAALEQGLQYINNFYNNPENSKNCPTIPDPPENPVEIDFNIEDKGHLAITASFSYYRLDIQDPNIITVIGTASVNNIRRTLEHDINVFCQLSSTLFPGGELDPNKPLLDKIYNDIETYKKSLNYPTVLAIDNINLNGVLGTIEPKKILTENEDINMTGVEHLDKSQQTITYEYQNKSVNWVNQTMLITENDNRLLFYRNDDNLSERYEDLGIGRDVINSSFYGKDWKYPFDYNEDRAVKYINGQRQIIVQPKMTLKKNQVLSLEPGLYYFSKLTLESGSTLKTNGVVEIFASVCELKEGAKMLGGVVDVTEAYPQNLKIIIESTLNYENPYIKLEARSEIYGDVIALNGLVNVTNGIGSDKTKIQGSVLSKYLTITKQNPNGSFQIVFSSAIQTSGSSISVKTVGALREV